VCGLFGALDFGRLAAGAPWNPAQRRRFDALRDRLAHRGPDGASTWSSPGVLMGHRRLAILDLTDAASQPMVSPAGTVLILNGEIYNYIELRERLALEKNAHFASSGDTAVLLEALDRWGLERTLAEVRGMFAFAAWRPAERQLWLARDPVGKKPLFVGRHGDALAFGSAMEPVLAWLVEAGLDARVDVAAVDHVLACGWVPAPRTGILGVEKLEAGTRRVVHGDGRVVTERHWTIPFQLKGRALDRTRKEALAGLFEQAISRRLRSDVPVATLLSGGLDSALVTAAASRSYNGLVAYTVRTRDNNEDEFKLACDITRHLGVDHRVVETEPVKASHVERLISQYGEPFCDSSALPTAAICAEAGRDHRVVLTGDGGDEVQGGYTGARLFALRALLWAGDGPLAARLDGLRGRLGKLIDDPMCRLDARIGSLRFRLLRLLAPVAQAMIVRNDGLELASEFLRPEARHSLGRLDWPRWVEEYVATTRAAGGLDTQLGFDFGFYLADDLNVKVDVAAMASSVETRAPLLDVDFVAACWGIRPFDRVRPWARKRIVADLARRYLPRDLVIRRKQGFSVPMGHWLETPEMDGRLREMLHAPARRLAEVIDTARISRTLTSTAAAGRSAADLRWRLLVLDEWARWIGCLASEKAAA
jgi:asparagine synthase (glutamine-hydrolysing)